MKEVDYKLNIFEIGARVSNCLKLVGMVISLFFLSPLHSGAQIGWGGADAGILISATSVTTIRGVSILAGEVIVIVCSSAESTGTANVTSITDTGGNTFTGRVN